MNGNICSIDLIAPWRAVRVFVWTIVKVPNIMTSNGSEYSDGREYMSNNAKRKAIKFHDKSNNIYFDCKSNGSRTGEEMPWAQQCFHNLSLRGWPLSKLRLPFKGPFGITSASAPPKYFPLKSLHGCSPAVVTDDAVIIALYVRTHSICVADKLLRRSLRTSIPSAEQNRSRRTSTFSKRHYQPQPFLLCLSHSTFFGWRCGSTRRLAFELASRRTAPADFTCSLDKAIIYFNQTILMTYLVKTIYKITNTLKSPKRELNGCAANADHSFRRKMTHENHHLAVLKEPTRLRVLKHTENGHLRVYDGHILYTS